MSDIHDLIPNTKIDISRVGAESIKLILKTKRRDAINILYPSVNVYVDLPLNMKGVHISRNLESLNEVMTHVKEKPVRYLENLCSKIAKILLKNHDYSNRAEVSLKSDYYLSRKAPLSDNVSGESCVVFASAIATKSNQKLKVRKFIGAEITGLTYCPCLLQSLEEESLNYLIDKLKLTQEQANKIIKNLNLASHNQRCNSYVLIETTNKVRIDLDDLIEIIESSFSSPTYSLLKRKDELEVIKQASKKPMFVEDVLREISFKIIEKYPHLLDDFIIHIRVVSKESIHKYDIISENKTNIKKLKQDLGIKS